MDMRQWYTLYTKPHQETLVCRQLEDRGLEVFFPYVQYDRGYGRGTRMEPFFPHYLFVHVDLMAPEASTLQGRRGRAAEAAGPVHRVGGAPPILSHRTKLL